MARLTLEVEIKAIDGDETPISANELERAVASWGAWAKERGLLTVYQSLPAPDDTTATVQRTLAMRLLSVKVKQEYDVTVTAGSSSTEEE